MDSVRLRVFIQIIVLLFIPSSAWAEAGIDEKVTKHFKVNWTSINYNKWLTIQKTSPENQEEKNHLSLSCEIEIVNPDLVLGTTRQGVITQLMDPNGQNITAAPSRPAHRGLTHMGYEGLHYRRQYVHPPQLNQWLSRIQSALKLPKRARPQPKWVNELQPSRMQVQLDAGLCQQAGGQIGRIKGHLYALMTESLEHVDIPFKPNENWVRLTDDVEVQVTEAQCNESSFRLRTEARRQGRASMRPLSADDILPSRIVFGRLLIGPDDKIIQDHSGRHSLPAHVGGSSSGSGGDYGQIKKIRYKIAVNPCHYKVPFEFEHIPLPKP